MRRVWTLAAMTAVAVGAGAVSARSVIAATPAAAHAKASSAVTALSVIPTSGRAEVVIAIDNSVEVQDFALNAPHRIVLDLTGATLGVPPRFYDKVARGGITNIRLAQYRANVVRVVVDLDKEHEYEVSRTDGEIRVSIAGNGASFAAWHAGAELAARTAARPESAVASAVPSPSVFPTSLTASAPRAVAPAAQQSTQPRITVTYQDADIRDVIAAFAAFSGRTIVVGRQVGGTITAEIRDQPWDVALLAILQTNGLALSEDPSSGIITVDSYQNILAKQASEPLQTQLVAVNYANASSLVATISSLLSKDCSAAAAPGGAAPVSGAGCVVRGSIAADTATNTLLITEVPSRMADMVAYVNALDIRTPQVAIKAKIIFVSRTDIEELGISYDIGTANQFSNKLVQRDDPITGAPGQQNSDQIQLGGDVITGTANARRNFANSGALSLIYSTMIGKFTLTAFLDALQEVRLSDTQAEPNIVTLDNRAASILVGEETPIRVIDASGGGGTSARANVQFKESGIRLDVTPHITNNRQILMTLHAEQSQLQPAAADLGFSFLKRRADTQLLVNDGETAVIGGLTITQVTTSKSGIPFLVDLPIIGKLFGETRTQEAKQDLLILITPHIVDEGEAVRPVGSTGR